MKVLLVNTSEQTGGAAIAASRLMEALNKNGVKAKMLVRDKRTDRVTVVSVPNRLMPFLKFVWERAVIWLHNRLKMEKLWLVDIANTGTDITRLPEFQEADVIHLHWVSQGFLSLNDLKKILWSGKRVVWTMHDQWPYTGICHYSSPCDLYQTCCHNCPQLCYSKENDLARKVFLKKKEIYQHSHFTLVGCSQWIAGLARKSALAKGQHVTSIPNAIPSDIFHPMDQTEARREFHLPQDKRLILFGSLKVTDERKGVHYLIDAYKLMQNKPGIVVVGKATEKVASMFASENGEVEGGFYPLEYITDERRMATLYAAVDAYVTPSLQDNLPNTIAEAMSCGTPCVGFRVGGIPEMIDHRENGYVAQYCNAEDLARGIEYVMEHDLRKEAHQKAAHMFSETSVAQHYIRLYEE